MTQAELEQLMLCAGRNEAPAILIEHYYRGDVDDDAVADALPGVWSGAEWPTSLLDESIWVDWFRDIGYLPPRKTLTVYRGADESHARGMSWTTDPDTARWFADRCQLMTGRPTHIYRFEAPPESVLADIDLLEPGGRGEHEIVIDPDYLPDVPERLAVPGTKKNAAPKGDVQLAN